MAVTNLVTVGMMKSFINSYTPPLSTEATRLSNSGTISVNLQSTTSPTYTSGGDITVGVQGILPVSMGGTGVTDLSQLIVGTASALSTDAGDINTPVYFSSGVPVEISVKNMTSVGNAGYDVSSDRLRLITLNTLACWNGAYQSSSSNLQYCVGGDIVGTSNNQSITGNKTFLGNNIIQSDFSRNSVSVNTYKYTEYLDGDGNLVGVIGQQARPDGYYGVYLQGGNEGVLGVFSNGSTSLTFAPDPPSGDSSNQIATTRWVSQNASSNLSFNTDSFTVSGDTVSLNPATQTTYGGIKIYRSGTSLYIETEDI